MRCIVCNTGPLLHLGEARAVELLELAGEVHIPRAVDWEMGRQEGGWSGGKPIWLRVSPLVPPHDAEAGAWQKAGLLDAGEAEATALARQLGAHWFLTDDAAARLLGTSLGLEVHGSLGIVLWAAAKGHLARTQAEATMKRLAESSLWISPRLLAEVHAALNQLFSSA